MLKMKILPVSYCSYYQHGVIFTYFPYTQKFVEVSSQITFFHSTQSDDICLLRLLSSVRQSHMTITWLVLSIKKVSTAIPALFFMQKMIDKMHFCIIF